jgi:hypothetical protein
VLLLFPPYRRFANLPYNYNEHSEKTRAPHTRESTSVLRCGALSLLQKAATLQGGSSEFIPSPCVATRAQSANHAGLKIEEHRAGHILATRGLVVKHVYPIKLRVVAAAVLAVTADAVLIAQHLQKLGAHLVTALACLKVRNLSRRISLKAGSTREKKGGGAGKRACIPNGKPKRFYHSDLSVDLGEIYVSSVLYYLAKAARANPALSIAITQSPLRGCQHSRAV